MFIVPVCSVLEEILRHSQPPALFVRVNKLVNRRRTHAPLATHPIQKTLCCCGKRVNRRKVFFFEPQEYRRFKMSLCRLTVSDFDKLWLFLRQFANLSVYFASCESTTKTKKPLVTSKKSPILSRL